MEIDNEAEKLNGVQNVDVLIKIGCWLQSKRGTCPQKYTYRLSSFLFLKKDSLEYMSRKMLRSEIYPESWNIIFHRSTCGAMFFTDVLHRC